MAFAGFLLLLSNAAGISSHCIFLLGGEINVKIVFLIMSIIATLWVRKPIFECSSIISGTGTKIRITVGNIFNQRGDIVIPVDSSFNTRVDEKIISKGSIHGQFIEKYFSINIEVLNAILKEELGRKPERLLRKRVSKNNGNTDVYSIGTSVILDDVDTDRDFILCAMADLNEHDIARTCPNRIYDSCTSIFELYQAERTKCNRLNMPLVGTNFGRTFENNRMECILIIICSFLKERKFTEGCNELNIVIYDKDYYQSELNIYNLKYVIDIICSNPKFIYTLYNLHR